MTAGPGWYEADRPGMLRWWDGTQWTAHEAPMPEERHPEPAAADAVGPRPGWYRVRPDVVRWWDGRVWTASRIRNDRVGIDGAATESPAFAWAMGGVFVALAALQTTFAVTAGVQPFTAVSSVVLAALFLAMAAQTTLVRREPAPRGEPIDPDAVRPLPGTVEASGAGWYPVSRTASRWWTGSRWTGYLLTRWGVRPTFHAERALATQRIVVLLLAIVAVGAVVAGIVMLGFAARGSDPGSVVGGWVLIAGGVAFGVLVAALVVAFRSQTRVLLIPSEPPSAPMGSTRG